LQKKVNFRPNLTVCRVTHPSSNHLTATQPEVEPTTSRSTPTLNHWLCFLKTWPGLGYSKSFFIVSRTKVSRLY